MNCDENGERFSSAASSNKSEVRELCELVLHDSCAVSYLSTVVVIIATLDADECPIRDLLEIKHEYTSKLKQTYFFFDMFET